VRSRGISRSHSVEKSFWKRIWTCRESDRILNELMNLMQTFGRASSLSEAAPSLVNTLHASNPCF
jgi:hypothetical protein